MFSRAAEQQSINLTSSFENDTAQATIYGDEHCIRRAIINLISNAIKFTTEGGSVNCVTFISDQGDLHIEIRDSGIGIPEERVEHVLNPFDQILEDQYLNEEGTGLGLSIVSHLTDLHQGEFKLSSQLGIGTTATIVLPGSRVNVEPEPKSRATSA